MTIYLYTNLHGLMWVNFAFDWLKCGIFFYYTSTSDCSYTTASLAVSTISPFGFFFFFLASGFALKEKGSNSKLIKNYFPQIHYVIN